MKKFFALLLGVFALTLNSIAMAEPAKLNTPEWRQYKAYIEQTVRHNWHPKMTQTTAKSQSIAVHLLIDRMGHLASVQIVSTVDEEMARSVRKAVIDSAPFHRPPAFPQDYNLPYADVDFTFDLVLKEFGPKTRILEGGFHWRIFNSLPDDSLKFVYMDYLRQVQKNLRAVKYKKMPPAHTMIQFNITKDGEIKDVQVIEPSKNPQFDKAALKNVQNLSVPHIPRDLNLDVITVQCVMSNAHGIITPGRI